VLAQELKSALRGNREKARLLRPSRIAQPARHSRQAQPRLKVPATEISDVMESSFSLASLVDQR
jgi:hypothetical protein